MDVLTKFDSEKREMTSFVFQNLQVLATGQKLNSNQRTQKNQDSASDDSHNVGYNTVTLAVTPEQAEILMYLEDHPLRLILRGPNDDEIVSVPPESESDVLSKLGRFVSSPRHSIEIIRGGSKQGE